MLDVRPVHIDSSSAEVTVPAGGTVLFAGLYWGARTQGTTFQGDPTRMLLRGPGGAYQRVTTQASFGPGTFGAYQQFADVTTTVQAGGAGTWWGANVAAATGTDRYAGWSLVVVFRDPAAPLRNLTVFDGYGEVSSSSGPQTITISGFKAPPAGTVQARVGMVAYEGDRASTGDRATLQNTVLSTPVSPGDNFFDSTIDRNGVIATDRNPAYANTLGYDIKDVGVPGAIAPNSTSATITLKTGGETYNPGVVTTAIDIFAPDFSSSRKTVVDEAGNSPAAPGDSLLYTVTYPNTGQDPADRAIATDVLPPNVTYVPGSIEVASGPNAGAKTDAAGDDQAEFNAGARTITVRLGSGATASAGGTIAPETSTAFRFRVTVDPAAAGTTITNRSSLAYVARTLARPFSYTTNPAEVPVQENADLALTKTTASDPAVAGQTVTSTLRVTNNGPNPAQAVVLTDPLPDGVSFVSATPGSAGCSESAGVVSCAIGVMANGATVTISIVGQIAPGSTAAALTNIATVSSDTPDPNLTDNTAGATVGLETQADLTINKAANPATVVPGQQITFTLTATNQGPSTAQQVTVNDTVDPSQFTIVSASSAVASCTTTPTTVVCTDGALAAGATATVTVVAQVPPGFTGSSAANTATVESNGGTPDPEPTNNTATIAIPVGPPQADLAVTKTGLPASVVAGGQVTYTIGVVNNGPSDATGVVLTDPLPTGVSLIDASSTRGPCDAGPPVSCPIGTLGPGTPETVTITAAVSPDAPPGRWRTPQRSPRPHPTRTRPTTPPSRTPRSPPRPTCPSPRPAPPTRSWPGRRSPTRSPSPTTAHRGQPASR